MSFYGWRPYVPVAQRRAQAAKKAAKFAKAGRSLAPVSIEGRGIAKTFWGKAWCQHLESFSDYENRLPRGRTYARNGSILDLQISPGSISALVMGSELYEIKFSISPLEKARWKAIKERSTGQIDSLVELLQGRFSDAVMRVITDRDSGLFPAPSEIEKSCSCPDWAGLCKHLAAALYGIGARLDEKPELLFLLRGVDHTELLGGAPAGTGTDGSSALDSADLADVFGIEIAAPDAIRTKKSGKQKAKPKTSRPAKPVKKPPAKKAATKRPSSTMPKKPVKKVVLPDKLKAARGRRAKRKKQAFQIRAQGKK
ncbi:MAG: SWIM zinc finger family protein [Verrucomicrobiota bacterium]